MQQEISPLLQTGGFTPRKRAPNHSTFLDNIRRELQRTHQILSLDNEDGVKTFRLLWNSTNDQIQVKNNITQVQSSHSTASTKLMVLATTASIFEPLGMLSRALIDNKIFLQKLCQDNLKWDEIFSAHLQQEWNQLLQTIPKLTRLKVTRKVICSKAVNIQIREFCNSSERVYGACLYILFTDSNIQKTCELLCSISKVAPLKLLTIPRLVLCAAILLSKLYK